MNSASPDLARLPLFPLQTVLFPGGLLPLRIFEVRYLDMIGRCHRAGTPFGVVCLSEGREVRLPDRTARGDGFAREAFFPVGTLARIDLLERPQPGLMLIRCTGTQRFRIRSSEQLPHGLWMAEAEAIDDDAVVAVPDDLALACTGLQQVVRSIEEQVADLAERPLQPPYRWDDCGWLANRWSELLPMSPDAKQRFMVLDNPLLRLELVTDALGQMGFNPPDAG